MAAKPKRINLALQGGGAHGAFTWGVLDAVLEDARLEIEAISGTSAGAMNAAAVAEGLVNDGRQGARACLRRFWTGVADSTMSGGRLADPLVTFLRTWGMKDWRPLWTDAWSRLMSPYDLNPMNLNPLRDLLNSLIDFEQVQTCDKIQIFVAATNVESGRTRIFKRSELTADHVMASACLPFLFHAVEIDGQAYWDGGFVGNPPLFPFFYESESRDVIVVQINPIERPGIPKSAPEIMDRVREVTFNASLMREFRNIAFVTRLIDEGRLEGTRHKKILTHRIDGGAVLMAYGSSSRMSADVAFFEELFGKGRAAAEAWIAENFDALGHHATLDVAAILKNPDVGV